MKLDTMKYLPELTDIEYIESFFEIKTILNKSEVNDSREIVINQKNRAVNILGSKIDQIYDVFRYLDNIIFQ
jgi:glutamine synthetase type III